ncbi:MAG: Uma2 family endonuclease [Chloroflexota bacterium]|nr:Uma2 family endonuclease [Chloroflexota bacterium]
MMVAEPTVKTGKKTVADWIAATEAGGNWELLDGELIPFGGWKDDIVGANAKHSNYVMLLIQLLLKIIPNGMLRTAPVGVILDDENTPEPDLFWMKEGGRCKEGETYWEGAPDLIVEILSPSTARDDRKRKFDLYEKHGVSEYWILDPFARLLEVYTLIDGKYQRLGIFDSSESFDSPALGVRVELGGVFA